MLIPGKLYKFIGSDSRTSMSGEFKINKDEIFMVLFCSKLFSVGADQFCNHAKIMSNDKIFTILLWDDEYIPI